MDITLITKEIEVTYDQSNIHTGLETIVVWYEQDTTYKGSNALWVFISLCGRTSAYNKDDSEIEFEICLNNFGEELVMVPDLYKMTEEEFFQYSLLHPYLKLQQQKIDIELLRAIIKYGYEQFKSFTSDGDSEMKRWVTFEY